MKGLWNSAKWELRESGLLNRKTAVTLGLWLVYAWNAAMSWNGSGVPLLLSFHLITFVVLAVYRGLKWPFTGSFDLERTSDRLAWQSVLGRTLGWAAVIAVGATLQQVFLRLCLDKKGELWIRIYTDGAERAARTESWIGLSAFLAVTAEGTAAYVLALAVALWCRSGRFRHRATMSAAVAWLLIAVVLGYLGHLFFPNLPLDLVGLGCILVGLPVSIWLLTYKAE